MNYDDIALNLIRRDTRERKRIERRLKAAHQEIKELITNFLKIDPDLQKVILFGSLAKGNVRSINFDIDLAVRCSQDKFLLLVAYALDRDFKVDVVDLDSISRTFRQFILNEGAVLYEKR